MGAREHFEGGGFTGAVRPEKSDQLARTDLEVDAVHRGHLAVTPGNQASQGAEKSGLLFEDAVNSAETARDDDRFHPRSAERRLRRRGAAPGR